MPRCKGSASPTTRARKLFRVTLVLSALGGWPSEGSCAQERAESALALETADSATADLRLFAPVTDATAAQEEAKWYQSPAFKATIAPATLITLGLFTFRDEGFLSRQEVRDWRNTFFPHFEDDFDDYSSAAPAVLAFGLNIAGVKGAHKLPRAFANYALSWSLSAVAVTVGKETSNVRRPDGSNTKSFPSQHTTTAFVAATFLHKEYGERSFLYSLTGYSMATLTGVFRQLNNRHWLSDVLVGAGVGIGSVEIGYALMNEIAGGWGVNPPPEVSAGAKPISGKPSFLDFRVGYAQQLGDLTKRGDEFFARDGWTAGFEGAWFFGRHFGIGGELSVAAFPIDSDGFVLEDTLAVLAERVETEPIGTQSLFVGPFVSYPIGSKFSVNGKLTGGWSSGATGVVAVEVKEEFREQLGPEIPVLEFNPKDTFGFAAGVGVRGMVSRNLGLALFAEYNYSSPDYELREIMGIGDGQPIRGQAQLAEDVQSDYFAVGATVHAMIW